jgi:uncharacterized lipoprotein YmbA
MTWRSALAVGLMTVGISACGTTPATRYLTLTAVPPNAPAGATGEGLVLRPPTVRWPAALDRLEVTQPGSGVVMTVAELNRWSAAPARLAAAALTQDLIARRPGLTLAHWSGPAAPEAATVDVEVEAIEARPDGYGLLAVVTIVRGSSAPQRRVIALHALGAPTAEGEARALSVLIAELADQVASDLSDGA